MGFLLWTKIVFLSVFMLFPDDLRLALPDFYRNGLCLHSGSLEAQESHHGFPAVGVALVEHEVAGL